MATGTVQWWDDTKGIGIITPDDGSSDLSVVWTELDGPVPTLTVGQRVSFEIGLTLAVNEAVLFQPI